uniref:Uncharacterized protein n=1 Tax=Leersia perrieri TaxID=77586 RepID=A0A0D9WCC5_9ORYZ
MGRSLDWLLPIFSPGPTVSRWPLLNLVILQRHHNLLNILPPATVTIQVAAVTTQHNHKRRCSTTSSKPARIGATQQFNELGTSHLIFSALLLSESSHLNMHLANSGLGFKCKMLP